MPLQNRVTPWGQIVAVSDRGLFMGNRGCLHNAGRQVVKGWARMPWVTCVLAFKDRQRQIMAPGQYTELFFLDEVTALAACHRPCAACRRDAYDSFKALWLKANPDLAATTDRSMPAIDTVLHRERVDATGQKRTWIAELGTLPRGTMIAFQDRDDPFLVAGEGLLAWSPAGYRIGPQLVPQTPVRVLTPASVVRVLALGYEPRLHPSVEAPLASEYPAPTNGPIDVEPACERAPAPKPAAPDPSASRPAIREDAGRPLHRLVETPRGKALYAYTAAIFSVTGMDRGDAYPLKKFLGNFSGHLDAGRIEKAPGGYRLTPTGMSYFADRYRAESRQHIDKTAVEAMARLIRAGDADGWVPIEQE